MNIADLKFRATVAPMEFLRAVLASLFPQKGREGYRPASTVIYLRAALVSGLLEFFLFGYCEALQFHRHFLLVADHFAAGNAGTQLVALVLMVVSEFFYPLSLLCIILFVEGAVRALAAGFFDEVVPSLPVWAAMRLWHRYFRPSRAAAR